MITNYPVTCNKPLACNMSPFVVLAATESLHAKRYSMVTGDTVMANEETN